MSNQDADTTRTDQLTFQDPVKRYPKIEPPKQSLDGTGLDSEMVPKADLGEFSYRGTGRLEGRKALITGGDSGIGAATLASQPRQPSSSPIAKTPCSTCGGPASPSDVPAPSPCCVTSRCSAATPAS